jgi:signal peptidase I
MRAEGISMLPTYQSGSLNLVNRLAYLNQTPSRGDIVAIKLAGPHVLYVKRIIALPGERVSLAQGQVYVNGAPSSNPTYEIAAHGTCRRSR